MATTGKLEKVHVWLNRKQKVTSATVEISDTEVTVYAGKREFGRYSIIETVKDMMAWDVSVNGERARLVARAGCTCSGYPTITPDPEYSGALS